MTEYFTNSSRLPNIQSKEIGPEPQPTQEMRRADWLESRAVMEQYKPKSGVVKRYSKFRFKVINFLFRIIVNTFKVLGLHDRLIARAAKLNLTELDFHLNNLPTAFDGYRILHISDPHFESLPRLEDSILAVLGGRSVDVAVLTGDITNQFNCSWKTFLPPMHRLISEIEPVDGFFAVLGNHDSWRMVAPFLYLLAISEKPSKTGAWRGSSPGGLAGLQNR